jgi:two-component system nitrogen regulation response regulator NtrX
MKRLSPDAVAVVKAYPWPGNVRELRNVIERLMIMVPGEVIGASDMTFLEIPDRPVHASPANIAPLYEARDAWEREYILGALSAFEGNISRTADALGVERSNLYRKMRGLGIPSGKKEEDEDIVDR